MRLARPSLERVYQIRSERMQRNYRSGLGGSKELGNSDFVAKLGLSLQKDGSNFVQCPQHCLKISVFRCLCE